VVSAQPLFKKLCFIIFGSSLDCGSCQTPEVRPIFWPIVLSVEPMVQYVVCRRLPVVVCLSSSVTFCIVAKRCILAKKCLKERIGNQGQKVHFFGRRHMSTSGFAATAIETAVFCFMYCGETVRPSQKVSEGVNRKPGSNVTGGPRTLNILGEF